MYNYLLTVYKNTKPLTPLYLLTISCEEQLPNMQLTDLREFILSENYDFIQLEANGKTYTREVILNSDLTLIRDSNDKLYTMPRLAAVLDQVIDEHGYEGLGFIISDLRPVEYQDETSAQGMAMANMRLTFSNKYWFTPRDNGNEKYIIIDDTLYPPFSNRAINLKENYVISRWASRELVSIPPVPIHHLCGLLGYRMTDVEKIFKAAKRANKNIVLIGFGGANNNLLYWINEIASYLGIARALKIHRILDDDTVEWHNFYRFADVPQGLNEKRDIPKIELFNNFHYSHLDRSYASALDYRITAENISLLDLENPSVVVVGAPDINTRHLIVNWHPEWRKASIVFNTHSGTEATLQVNPSTYSTNDIATETYGRVPRTVFFLNQIHMAIKFMELLPNIHNARDYTYNFDYAKAWFADEIKIEPCARRYKLCIPRERDLQI